MEAYKKPTQKILLTNTEANSSFAHYSATFQAIKEQEEKVKTDFTSDNTEVYNKPFRLRDLRRSIMKAKPRAPGPDGTTTICWNISRRTHWRF